MDFLWTSEFKTELIINSIYRPDLLLFCSATRYEAVISCRELSLVYHGIHQLQLVNESENREHLSGLVNALTAVNLAEAAGVKLPSASLIDIYVSLALRLKTSCPNFLQPLQRLENKVRIIMRFVRCRNIIFRYYLGWARQAANNCCDPVPSRLQWIFTPYGFKFFTSRKFDFRVGNAPSVPFSTLGNGADPIAHVLKVQKLLKK